MSFTKKLSAAWDQSQSLLMVGLDPDVTRLPDEIKDHPDAIFEFCRRIVDATAPYVCGFKPQIAYFAAARAEHQLEDLCAYMRENYPALPIVLDAKRGDIGATATQYAQEVFGRYGADAVTVSPYLGADSVEPYLQWGDRYVHFAIELKDDWMKGKSFQYGADGYIKMTPSSWYFPKPL